MEQVEFFDWQKLDIRIAEIKNVEEIEGADKLWKLSLNVGELGERTICAGIKQAYSKENLIGEKIVYFANLKPRVMKGIESQGMLLAASSEDHSKIILLAPEQDIESGTRVG
jgi:methionyl-tRNA synthetase